MGHRSAAALLDSELRSSPLRGRPLRSRSYWPSANGHREARLGPVQCLDLALFIHTQDDGVLGWIQVKRHDIHQLLFELWIVADLETYDPVRLESISFSDSPHRAFTHACGLCHRRPAPVRCIGWSFLSRLLNDLLALHGDHP